MKAENNDHRGSPVGERPRGGLRCLAILCALGVALRLTALILAGELELQSDEANYVYLALTWDYFGFYADSYRYLWPPGYPFLLRWAFRLFEYEGLFAVKLLQVFASASIGWFTMLMARRIFGARAAVLAGVIWCLYVPLIGFSHFLWTETLFLALLLPSLYLLLAVLDSPQADREARPVLLAGTLFGLSLYLKEVHLYLAPILGLALLLPGLRNPERLPRARRQASLFLLVIAAVLAPWALRNYETYGRFIPVGASLGENCYLGLNASYKNFDTTPFARHRLDRPLPQPRTGLIANEAEGWERAEEITHTYDKTREGVRRGLTFARENPGWFVRSRLKKLADLVAPISFYTRHLGLGRYADSPLGSPVARRVGLVLAMSVSAAVMVLGLAGAFSVLRGRAASWFLPLVAMYFVATASIVAMSRFRIPFVPLAIVLSAGFLTSPRMAGPRKPVALGISAALFCALWWIDLPEIQGGFGMAWETAP